MNFLLSFASYSFIIIFFDEVESGFLLELQRE